MSFSRTKNSLLLLVVMALAGCSGQAPSPVNGRLAIEQFENQSASADENWVGVLLANATAQRLASDPQLAVNVVHDAEGWRTLGAGRVLSGVYRKTSAGYRIDARLTDTATSSILGRMTMLAAEPGLIDVTAKWVETLLARKPMPLEGDLAAWKVYSQANTEDALQSVVERFPNFSLAYPTVVERLLRLGKAAEAQAIAARLPQSADALTKAQTALLVASSPQAKLAAAKSLVALRPSDSRLRGEVAGAAANLLDWPVAVEQYRELTKLEPTKPEWWNSLGYAHANLAQLPEAVQALNEYRRLLPNEPNTLDSLGEVNYLNRNFKEAARNFDEEAQRFPTFQNGVAFRKAAFAHYYAGDLKSADLRFDNWSKQVLASAPPRSQKMQQALWLARTGRQAPAQEFLKTEAAKSTGELKIALSLYLDILRFGINGTRPAVASLQAYGTQIQDANLRAELSVFALLSQPAANEAALAARINAAIPQPQLASLRQELLTAAHLLYTPLDKTKPKLFALPTPADSAIGALLLRFDPAA